MLFYMVVKPNGSTISLYSVFKNYVVLHGSKPKKMPDDGAKMFKNYVVLRRYGIVIINK